jgi:small subunit ribosomal protein S7
MPRKGFVRRREPAADPKYDSVLVTRFINGLMETGKRSIAERHFYGAMTMVEQKTGQDAMTVLKMAMTNVKPMLEVKSRRVGGANYQVPVEVRPDRRNALATRSSARTTRSRRSSLPRSWRRPRTRAAP